MFALLAGQSVLRNTVAGEGHDAAAFAVAVAQSMSRPERLAADLFTLRAEGLLQGLDAVVARSRLSGLLVGAELAAMRPYWLGQAVAIIGAGGVASAYAEALAAQGVEAERIDGSDMALKGLRAIWNQTQGGAA
jgi:2-dehydro-3-deoxygalactonokinase